MRNEPESQKEEIQQLVKRGFLVRTRADADFSASNEDRAKQVQAAIDSGAQMISTDFYTHSPQAEKTGYAVSFDDGAFKQHNALIN